jgi:hypothetical protein
VVQRRVTVPAPRRARYNDVEEDFRVAHVLDLTLENPARPPPDHRSTASTPPPSRSRSARTCRGDRRTGRACACRARPGAVGRHAHITDVGWAARQVGMPAVGPPAHSDFFQVDALGSLHISSAPGAQRMGDSRVEQTQRSPRRCRGCTTSRARKTSEVCYQVFSASATSTQNV